MPIQLHTKPQGNEIKKWDETQSLEHQVWETRTHFSRQHIQVLARVLAALPAHERGGNVASQLQDLSMIFQHHPSTIYTMSIFILQIFAAMTVWIHILLWSTKPLNRRVSIAGRLRSLIRVSVDSCTPCWALGASRYLCCGGRWKSLISGSLWVLGVYWIRRAQSHERERIKKIKIWQLPGIKTWNATKDALLSVHFCPATSTNQPTKLIHTSSA